MDTELMEQLAASHLRSCQYYTAPEMERTRRLEDAAYETDGEDWDMD